MHTRTRLSSSPVVLMLTIVLLMVGCGSSGTGDGTPPDATGEVTPPDVVDPPEVTDTCTDDSDCINDNACMAVSCLEGSCVSTPTADAPCDDENVCTEGETCSAEGVCEGGEPIHFTEEPCQVCTCDPVEGLGCGPANAGDACSDSDCCTVGDSCIACDPAVDENCPADGLTCMGSPKPCDDGNECTVNTCACDENDVAECGSQHAADDLPCDFNENDCTTGDHCTNGVCVVGTPADLDDQNPCTKDYCEKGEIKHDALSGLDLQCDDQNECTTGDFCHVGTCTGGGPVVCTVPACASDASCVKDEGCVVDWMPNGAECDDGNPCTTSDQCNADHACMGETNPCDDQDPCTVDACDPDAGCTNKADPSTDGIACGDGGGGACGSTCQNGKCVASSDDGSCDDGNPCTEDTCDATNGCINLPWTVPTSCDDGDPCTSDDLCVGAVCEGTATGNEGQTVTCGQKNAFDSDGCCCFKKSHILDMGVQPANTTMECCLTPGFNQGCQDTATISVSSDGTNWETVDSYSTSSVAKPSGGWEAVCTTIPVVDAFQYVRGSNNKCYVDKFTCTLPCEGETTPGDGTKMPIIYDTWLESASSHGTHEYLIVGKDGNFPKKRALLRADIDQLTPGTVITKATLNVYFQYAHTASFASEACIDRNISVHEVYIPWSEAEATKTKATNTQNWTEELCGINDVDAAATPHTTELWACTDTKSWKTFDVTGLVQKWIDLPETNNGFLLRADNEDDNGRDMRFFSKDSGDASLHPYVEVTY